MRCSAILQLADNGEKVDSKIIDVNLCADKILYPEIAWTRLQVNEN